jgi:hypothetical protein
LHGAAQIRHPDARELAMPINDQYDFDEVLNDARIGNEPSAQYLRRIDQLDKIVRNCMSLSRQYAGMPSPTSRHYYASVLFMAMITRGVSLAIAAPHTPWATKRVEHWDYSTATGIVRTMLELRFAFHYLCVDPCSDEEWNCRWNVFNLHDCTTRRKLFEARETDPDQVRGFEQQAEELRERLRSNSHFVALPKKQRDKFLKGQTAYLFALEDIGEKAGVERSLFRWLFILFSSHVHGLPMSYYRIGTGEDERGRGLPSTIEENYTCLCLSFAGQLLVYTHDEMETLFGESSKAPVNDAGAAEKINVEEALKTEDSFKIGETRTILDDGVLRIELTMTDGDIMTAVYYHIPTNEPVLRRVISDSETGGDLEFYDQTYWRVLVNGKPATDSFLDGVASKRMAYKVDHTTRTLMFKLEDMDAGD